MALVSKLASSVQVTWEHMLPNALLFKGLNGLYLSDLDEVLCKAQVNDLLDAMPFIRILLVYLRLTPATKNSPTATSL